MLCKTHWSHGCRIGRRDGLRLGFFSPTHGAKYFLNYFAKQPDLYCAVCARKARLMLDQESAQTGADLLAKTDPEKKPRLTIDDAVSDPSRTGDDSRLNFNRSRLNFDRTIPRVRLERGVTP